MLGGAGLGLFSTYRFGGAEAFFGQKPCFKHGFHF